jgi:hypothetical protein
MQTSGDLLARGFVRGTAMMDDPIVEEARRAGQKYVDAFKGDWKALIADLRRRSRREGRKVVSLPPRPPRPRVITTH